MPAVQTEHVLVVPTKLFHRLGHFQGFSADVQKYLGELLDPANTSFRPRDEVEEDPGFKQLIPYVIFRHRDAAGRTTVFHYTRGKGQGEARLHSKRSVGVGGHISADDCTPDTQVSSSVFRPENSNWSPDVRGPYAEGMRRELAEEVHLDTLYTERCVGLINDDETPVGRVHLGVVHLFDVEQPEVRSRETDLLDSGFAPIADLLADINRFETWSQISLRALFAE